MKIKKFKINTLLILVSVFLLIFFSIIGCNSPRKEQVQAEETHGECDDCGKFEPVYLIVEAISDLSYDDLIAFFDHHAHMLVVETEEEMMALEIFVMEHFGDFGFDLAYDHDPELDPSVQCFIEEFYHISGMCLGNIVIHYRD